jgi:hypothetical protein
MIKSSFLLGSILPNFALWDQGGAQARRAAPLSGPAARPSLGAGRPGNQSVACLSMTVTGTHLGRQLPQGNPSLAVCKKLTAPVGLFVTSVCCDCRLYGLAFAVAGRRGPRR